MFEDEDHQALKTLINNQTLKAIQSIIKEDVHFWHHRDELLTGLRQLPNEGIHPLSTHIITIIGKCKFPLHEVKEMKFIVLQHTVKYHEVQDWICLPDQDILIYKSFLNYCTQLEARCKQYQQAQVQGRTQLTSITVALATPSSLHAQSATTNVSCGYTHPCVNCPAFNRECYNCHNKGHFTALCRKPRTNRCPNNASHRSSSKGRGRS